MGVLAIGENPMAGTPRSRKYRASVEAGKISGFPTFPLAFLIAPSNRAHQGFELSDAVRIGFPNLSYTETFCLNCPSYNHS